MIRSAGWSSATAVAIGRVIEKVLEAFAFQSPGQIGRVEQRLDARSGPGRLQPPWLALSVSEGQRDRPRATLRAADRTGKRVAVSSCLTTTGGRLMAKVNQTLPSAKAARAYLRHQGRKWPAFLPTVYFVGDKATALQWARALVTRLPDHLEAEVFERDRRVARVGRDEGPKAGCLNARLNFLRSTAPADRGPPSWPPRFDATAGLGSDPRRNSAAERRGLRPIHSRAAERAWVPASYRRSCRDRTPQATARWRWLIPICRRRPLSRRPTCASISAARLMNWIAGGWTMR